MNENLKKFNYTGDKPSPIVKADRMAKAGRIEAAEKLLKEMQKNHAKAVAFSPRAKRLLKKKAK
jgi:pentatricopeptide repeat protein